MIRRYGFTALLCAAVIAGLALLAATGDGMWLLLPVGACAVSVIDLVRNRP